MVKINKNCANHPSDGGGGEQINLMIFLISEQFLLSREKGTKCAGASESTLRPLQTTCKGAILSRLAT